MNYLFIISKRLGLECRNVNLFVTLLLSPERTFRKLAPLVGHEVRPGGEGHVLQAEDFCVSSVSLVSI